MDAFGHEATQQAGLRGDAAVALIADAEVVEIRSSVVTGQRVRPPPLDLRRLQSVLLQMAQGDVVHSP